MSASHDIFGSGRLFENAQIVGIGGGRFSYLINIYGKVLKNIKYKSIRFKRVRVIGKKYNKALFVIRKYNMTKYLKIGFGIPRQHGSGGVLYP